MYPTTKYHAVNINQSKEEEESRGKALDRVYESYQNHE